MQCRLPGVFRAVTVALFLVLLNTAPPTRGQIPPGGKRLLTLGDVWGPIQPLNSSGDLPFVTGWLADGTHYTELADNGAGEAQLMRVDARTGQSAPLYDAPRMEAAFAGQTGIDMTTAHRIAYSYDLTLSPDETHRLVARREALYLYGLQTGRVALLTAPDTKGNVSEASFSPDGKHVAFVRGGDLFVVDAAAPGRERRLTRDGSAKVLNGRLDWVYEEEVYGRGKTDGYAWSPDSNRLAFLRLDEKPVHSFTLLNTLSRSQDSETQLYPLPGEPNPVAALGIVGIDGTTPARFADLAAYPDQDRLLVRFGWGLDNAHLTCQIQDRTQTFLDLMSINPATGKTTRLLRETTPRWVEPTENPRWLKDGTFLWLSDRSGWRHLYQYRADGTLVRRLTTGEWDIRTLFGTDSANNTVYFSAMRDSPVAVQVYRLALDGRGGGGDAAVPQSLTGQQSGSHTARFDPTFTYFLDEWSGIATPPHLRVADTGSGRDIRILGDSAATVRQLSLYRLGTPEFVSVPTRDGFVMEGMVLRPPDFDPTKKYPVFCPVYGGPGSQTAKNEWAGRDFLFWQLLAQKGYVIWLCDNRSASGKGMQSQWSLNRRFGAGELADIEDGLAYLKRQPGIDGGRIGLFGWSYGGFLAEYALTHSKSFKVGIAAAGVADWRLYDSIYTERYLDTPQHNPDGYRASSPVGAAGDCAGRLLLLHGMMDDNVHFQNSAQMADALQKAGKHFDLMLYSGPRARHGFADDALDRHLNTLIVEFLLQNL